MDKPSNPIFPREYVEARQRYYGEDGSVKKLVKDLVAWKSAEREETESAATGRALYRKIFANLVTIAVVNDEPQFFRNMADALEATAIDNPLPEWESFVFSAFEVLSARGSFPNKLKVQRAAQRCRAFWSLVLEGTATKEKIYGEYMFQTGPARVEKIFAKKIKSLGEPVWTRIFRRCGLSWLDKDPGGRPKGSKNSLH